MGVAPGTAGIAQEPSRSGGPDAQRSRGVDGECAQASARLRSTSLVQWGLPTGAVGLDQGAAGGSSGHRGLDLHGGGVL